MRKKNNQLIIVCISVILITITLSITVENVTSFSTTIYPKNGWMTATPEEVGINSTELEKMEQFISDNEELGVDSVSIIRNGKLCYEKYYEYYNYSNLHNTFSVAKSVMSALIGIANDSGMISNLDQPVVEIFANRTIQNLDTRKEVMTIRHLLMMRSGLASNDFDVPFWRKSIPHNDFTFRTNASNEYPGTWINYLYPENDWTKLLNSSDWIQTSLDKPMDAEPGTTFTYSDNVGHLLAGIFQEKTGMIPEEFADQYLFGPLNITEYVWFKDPSGLNFGAGGLWLQPHDMLKFGYLYLNNGLWNNTQIIPEEWIEESTQDYNDFGYGYYWWINEGRSYYNADGLGGQRIYVKADEELVVAVTAWEGQISFTIDILFNNFILKAIIKNDTSTVVPTSTIPSNTTTSSDVFSIGLGLVILFSISQRKEGKT